MKLVKMIMIVAVAAGVLSLGACAQKKRDGGASASDDRIRQIVFTGGSPPTGQL